MSGKMQRCSYVSMFYQCFYKRPYRFQEFICRKLTAFISHLPDLILVKHREIFQLPDMGIDPPVKHPCKTIGTQTFSSPKPHHSRSISEKDCFALNRAIHIYLYKFGNSLVCYPFGIHDSDVRKKQKYFRTINAG